MRNRLKNEKQGNSPDNVARGIAILSFLVSFVTLYLSYWHPGKLVIHEPTSFCIVRGYEDIGFKSDHLIIPFLIENTGNGTKVFQKPTLSLIEKNSGQELSYQMAGFIPDLYRVTMDQSYEIGFEKDVPENTVGSYYLVFHIENWWDPTKPEYSEFRFKGGQQWEISLDYTSNGRAKAWQEGNKKVFFSMPIYTTIDRLEFGGSYNSDCFSLE